MTNIEIYTKDYCPYCHRAKALLDKKGVEYTEYDITHDADKQKEMADRSKARTVPQIFIDGQGIGGCDDIHMLDTNNELDAMIGLG
jgi:glutaredoxin 3